jgi:hypothetical protein
MYKEPAKPLSTNRLGMVVSVCNSSYVAGIAKRIMAPGQILSKK